jgi:hypothetical protein
MDWYGMALPRFVLGIANSVVLLPWHQPWPDHECLSLVVKPHANHRLDFDQISIIRRVTATHAAALRSTRPLRLRVHLAETGY